jgi:DNA polymerase I
VTASPSDPLAQFEQIWLVDTEFIEQPGERPQVVCLCAKELRTGRVIQLWHDQLTSTPPYRTGDRVLFVCFAAQAELGCHLVLGWPIPRYVLDLSPLFRNVVNGRKPPEGKGLIGAMRYYALDSIGAKKKDAMRDRVLKGWPFAREEREQVLAYCLSDVLALGKLLPKLMTEPEFDLGIALYHGEFVAASALMQHHGVPIEMEILTRLADEQTWRQVRDAMVPIVDADYGVYIRHANGDYTFTEEKFAAYLEREGMLPGWPRTETGKLSMKGEVWDEMSKCWPQLGNLRQLRHMRNKMRKVNLAVGRDGRNRTVLWPFQAKTSRTQPKASQWIFSPSTWLRSLIKPGPGRAVAYIDYSSMEFLLAASLSDRHCGADNPMLRMYESGDPYLAYIKAIGLVPSTAVKADVRPLRDLYKTMLLSVQYGIGPVTLAARLGVSTFEAQRMLEQHREQFAQYWCWSDDWLQHALQTGLMRTSFGWHCRTGITELNERSIRNFPIQATGADILRIAVILGTRHGLGLVAPVHDAVLLESSGERIEADVVLMREIMRRASRIVLNRDPSATHELRTDATIVRYPDRYVDERGVEMWQLVTRLLAEQEDHGRAVA